jgi:hypothetical protein
VSTAQEIFKVKLPNQADLLCNDITTSIKLNTNYGHWSSADRDWIWWLATCLARGGTRHGKQLGSPATVPMAQSGWVGHHLRPFLSFFLFLKNLFQLTKVASIYIYYLYSFSWNIAFWNTERNHCCHLLHLFHVTLQYFIIIIINLISKLIG